MAGSVVETTASSLKEGLPPPDPSTLIEEPGAFALIATDHLPKAIGAVARDGRLLLSLPQMRWFRLAASPSKLVAKRP